MQMGVIHNNTSPDQAPVSRHISVVFAANIRTSYTYQQSAAFTRIQWHGVSNVTSTSINAKSSRQPQHRQRWGTDAVRRRVSCQWLLVRERACASNAIITLNSDTEQRRQVRIATVQYEDAEYRVLGKKSVIKILRETQYVRTLLEDGQLERLVRHTGKVGDKN